MKPLEIDRIVSGGLKQNGYVIGSESGDALLVDPGGKPTSFLERVERGGLRVHAILNTHGHYDHVGAVAQLRRALSVPFYLHSTDQWQLSNANAYMRPLGGKSRIEIPRIDERLDGASELRFGDLHVRVLETPGHTPGSVCFAIGGHLFTGDTLFAHGVGPTDLPEGDPNELARSLAVLRSLSEDFEIRPGHGSPAALRDALRSRKALEAARLQARQVPLTSEGEGVSRVEWLMAVCRDICARVFADAEPEGALNPSTLLYGEGLLTSLDVLILAFHIECTLTENHGVTLDLINGDVRYEGYLPFRSVGALVDHVRARAEEAGPDVQEG